MRILHVDTGLTWRGGQQQVFNLHRGLCGMGIDSHLVCSKGGELERRAASENLPVTGMALRGEWDIFSARKIAALIKEIGVTHIHLHSSHAQAIGLIAARFAGLENVIATRRVDFVPSNHIFNRWKYGRGIKRFVAISSVIRQILLDFGVPADRISLVPSGVDPDKPRPGSGEGARRELGLGQGEKLVGNIAALVDHKGQKYLIDAVPAVLEKHPNTRFAIIGEGDLEKELKAQAAALNLGDHLIFTGFRTDVIELMDALDIFAMPSHMEGLGTIVMDALAARKPVVAAAGGGIPDIIEDGKVGVLVPVKDSHAFAEGLNRLLDDPELGKRLAEAGRAKVEERFSMEAMASGNLAVYREMIGN